MSSSDMDRNDAVIGIVTVLFNCDEVLPDFFESLNRQVGVKFILYVIDNSSKDSGTKLCRSLAAKFGIQSRTLFNNANLGVAEGNNLGIKMALDDGCRYVLLSNNDIVFDDPLLLKNMIAFCAKKAADAVVPKIYYYGEKDRIWCAGGNFSVARGTTPHHGIGKMDNGEFNRAKEIEYSPTCFMLVDSHVFNSIGMMDPDYFVYYDDADFVWRMRRSGGKLWYWPDGKIWHKVSFSTGGDEGVFSIYYFTRNRIIFIRKNYSNIALRWFAVGYSVATRLGRCIRYDKKQREAVWRGLKDGLEFKSCAVKS